jgi:hypothetical protein
LTESKRPRREKIEMLRPRPRDPALAVIERQDVSSDTHDTALLDAITSAQRAGRAAQIAPLQEVVAAILCDFAIDETHAEPIARLLLLGHGMAANESTLDAEWRSKEALAAFSRKPTKEAFVALHPLTRLRIIDKTLALKGASQDQRSLARCLQIHERRLYCRTMATAAAALAEEIDPVWGRPEVPDGLTWSVEALATAWTDIGPRWRDSKGKLRAPRVSESRNTGSFTDFCVRLLTIGGAFAPERIRGAVRTVAAQRRRSQAPAARPRVPRNGTSR